MDIVQPVNRRANAAGRPEVRRRLVRIVLVLGVAAGLFAWALTWDKAPARHVSEPLPVIAEVPQFSLIERDGRNVTRAHLLGNIWVADFIFTRCAGPCPELSAKMRGLQQSLQEHADVRLVSICLDPENDTPAALVHYAKRFQAEADRWWFLTGTDEKYVHSLVEKGFLQSVVPASGGSPLVHGTYIVVVDRLGRIRAAHNGTEASARDAILGDVESLLREQNGS